jgi:NAD(P)-dependent dehydrogenase (short-subunit alcohol dehydrogenase family)
MEIIKGYKIIGYYLTILHLRCKMCVEIINLGGLHMSKWTISNIPDLTGKIAIITGSTSGIGKQTAKVFASKNAITIMAVRNIAKGETVKQEFLQDDPNAIIHVMKLDLSDLQSVHSFVNEFKKEFTALHFLVNNAGVMMPPYSQTKDGFDIQMGTNHFGHYALTGLLFPILSKTADSRIASVSSMVHRAGNINFDDINWTKRKYKKMSAYGDSKLANLYFTYELNRLIQSRNLDIKVNAAHPGWTATDLQRHSGITNVGNLVFGQKPWKGALPTLRALFDEQLASGEYYGPRGLLEFGGYPKKVKSNKRSYNQVIAKQLFTISEQLTKVTF